MKITDHTEDMLIIDDKPWFAGLAMAGFGLGLGALGLYVFLVIHFGGIFFIVVAVGFFFGFYRFIERSQIVFYRPDGKVEFRKKSLHRYIKESYPLAEIDCAVVDERTSPSASGASTSARIIVLLRKDGRTPVPFTSSYASGSGFDGIALTVNEWLRQL